MIPDPSPEAVSAGLREAARLIVEVGWTRCALARNSSGRHALPMSSKACCYCAIGAICRAFGVDLSSEAPRAALACVAAQLYSSATPDGQSAYHMITDWNDHPLTCAEDVHRVLLVAAESPPF